MDLLVCLYLFTAISLLRKFYLLEESCFIKLTTEGDMSMQIMKIKKCLFCHRTCFWNNTPPRFLDAQEAIKP